MKAVITVIGIDQVGIVHKVTGLLVEYKFNIIDITQTILDGYFTMIMIVESEIEDAEFEGVVKATDDLSKELGVSIHIQNQDLFDQMHQV